MIETKMVAPNGATVETMEAGRVYDVPAHIAEALQAAGWAAPVQPETEGVTAIAGKKKR